MKVKCLFFAGAKDIVGSREVMIECEEMTLEEFKNLLLQKYPDLSGKFFCCINFRFIILFVFVEHFSTSA